MIGSVTSAPASVYAVPRPLHTCILAFCIMILIPYLFLLPLPLISLTLYLSLSPHPISCILFYVFPSPVSSSLFPSDFDTFCNSLYPPAHPGLCRGRSRGFSVAQICFSGSGHEKSSCRGVFFVSGASKNPLMLSCMSPSLPSSPPAPLPMTATVSSCPGSGGVLQSHSCPLGSDSLLSRDQPRIVAAMGGPLHPTWSLCVPCQPGSRRGEGSASTASVVFGLCWIHVHLSCGRTGTSLEPSHLQLSLGKLQWQAGERGKGKGGREPATGCGGEGSGLGRSLPA